MEWIDIVLLSLDGAWRAGFSPVQIAQAIDFKQSKNEARQWPDWRTAELGKAIEHILGGNMTFSNAHVYISGPMTGLPNHNYPAFMAEARRLRLLGYAVWNPAEINKDVESKSRAACLRDDIFALACCNTIQFLPGWKKSQGARLEHRIAKALEMKVFYPLTPITKPE